MKKKMQGFAKKGTAVFFKCLMICFLFLLQLNLPDTVIHAVSGFGDAPDITVKFAYKSGGIIPTDNKGNNIANTVLVGREGSSSAIVDLQIDPQFSSGEITAPYFTLDLPYFYYDASGTLVSTFDIDAVPEDSKENGEPKMGLQAIVRDNKDYSVDKNTVFKGGSDKINKNVIRGDALTIQSGTPSAITLEFVFYGDVPENASCIATVGGGYANYTDTNGNTTEYNHYVPNGGNAENRFTFICSNLQWDAQITPVSKNVLWDKYNYMVYQVDIINQSEDDKSYFNSFDLSLELPVYDTDYHYGIRRKDMRKWLYNEDGDPVLNDDTDDVNGKKLTGVPKDGGMLLYDITDIGEAELEKWDLNDFHNVEEKPGYYNISQQTGLVYLRSDKQVQKGEKRSYYMAVPFPRNFDPNMQPVITKLYGTVYFGDGKYSWTKTANNSTYFETPKSGFEAGKYVHDETGNEVKKTQAAIGDNVTYYLSGFKNTGNIPAFEASATDTLPENFKPKKISISMPKSGSDEPSLTDWFADQDILELEFEKADHTTSFVALGAFLEDSALSSSDKTVWSVDFERALNDYLRTHANESFTGNLRINFKNRIEPKEAFSGEIMVQGVLPVQSTYENALTVNYNEWQYVQDTAVTEETYQKFSKEIKDKAEIETVPGNPLIQTDTYLKNSDNEFTYQETTTLPVYTKNVGYRYRLGNDSISDIIPAVFDTGNLLTQNNSQGVYGFITDSILLSKGLQECAVIANVKLTYADGSVKTVAPSSFTKDEKGNLVYQLSGKTLKSAEVNFTSFRKNTALSDDIYVAINGTPNMVGDVEAEGSFKTQYQDASVDTTAKDKGKLKVDSIDMQLKASSYHKDSYSGENTSAGGTIQHLQVPNKEADTGYLFNIANTSSAASGGAKAWVDLSSQITDRGTADHPMIKGFLTDEITISNIEKTAEIRAVHVYEYGQEKSDQAKLVLQGSDLIIENDTIVITKEALASAGIDHAVYVLVEFDNYLGQTAPQQAMQIRLNGTSDWYDNLDAVLTFIPDNPFMIHQMKDVTARLQVKRPTLSVHTNLGYYDNVPETSVAQNSNTDKNRTLIAIPYDRDFNIAVSVKNEEDSVLDNPVLTVQLPVNDHAQGDESHTGFHATALHIDNDLLTGFKTIEHLYLYDADQQAPAAELTYDAEGKAFKVSTTTLPLDADGGLTLNEQQLQSLGITYLNKLELEGYEYALQKEGRINIKGFSDANLGTTRTVSADAGNYLDRIHQDDYEVKTKDDSQFFTSKMYFDTTLSAGYKDSEGGERFDKTATAREHVRLRYANTSSGLFYDNSELDVGYKAIGSYMLDFRQYLNAGTNYPKDPTRNNYSWQEPQGYSYLKTEAYNTAMSVNMNLTLPSDKFETYYLKVDPRAKEYFTAIDVIYADGSRQTIQPEEWQSNSVETNAEGNTFFRIALMEGSKKYGNEERDYYRSPKNYAIPDNPVTNIVVHLKINQKEAADDKAANPDYGTWYDASDQKTKYMFEVTGRFYREGNAKANVTADLQVGGDEGNGAARTGVKAKVRTNAETKSSWSYRNQYVYYWYSGYSWHSANADYDAQHLKSDAHVVVSHDKNQVVKGVHKDPSVNADRKVIYGDDQDYAVSFFRQPNGGEHDYVSGRNTTDWYSEDPLDWSGKISYADQIILEDILPAIHEDKTDDVSEYYGFLTKNIRISEQLEKYIDHVELTTKFENEKGEPVNGKESRTITLHKGDLGIADNGFYHILLKYQDRSETADEAKPYEIQLEHQEYVKGYKIYLKDLPGSADFAREYQSTQLQKADSHGTNKDVDVYVGGTVYLIDKVHPDKDATNTIQATTYKDETDADGSPMQVGVVGDTALLMGYQIPFKAGFDIDSLSTSGSRTIYDYEPGSSIDGLKPSYAGFGVKIFNQNDGSSSDGSTDAAHIKTANLNNTMHADYRLKHIYIPKELIDGSWFEVSTLTLNYGNSKTMTYKNKQEIKASKYLSVKDENTYVFDVNSFVIDHVGDFATYTAANTSNVYVKDVIQSFQMTFTAVNPVRTDAKTVLDAGQYLTADKAEGYTITYDGVYVDRTAADIQSDSWTSDSRPTRLNDANHYNNGSGSSTYYCYNYADTSFVSSDLNAMKYGGNVSTDKEDYYNIANTVADLYVNLKRGKTVDGKDAFAYDHYLDGADTKERAVDRDHLTVHDYVEYELTFGVNADSALPSTHPDLRFTTPDGMRIIGWKIKENTTDISPDDISAMAAQKNNTPVSMKKDGLYTLQSNDPDTEPVNTNYKELNISVGQPNAKVEKGKVIRITVITQLNDEIKPFEGKTITPVYEAAAAPVNSYSQYRIYRENVKDNNGYSLTSPYATTDDIKFYRGYTDFYRTTTQGFTGKTYESKITSELNFMDTDDLHLEYEFDDKVLHYDHQPMTLKLRGADAANAQTQKDVTNNSLHDLDSLTYKISFLSESNGYLYKGFELTDKPEFHYPKNMNQTDLKDIKIEYCYLQSKTRNAADGVYDKNDVEKVWIDQKDVVVNAADLSTGKQLLKDAVGIRWTYYDIPALGTDAKEVVFATVKDPFILKGEGRYRDIRTDAQQDTKQYADRYKMELDADVTMVHKHEERLENTAADDAVNEVLLEQDVELGGLGEAEKNIARERPVVALQTQIFETKEQAEQPYDASAKQKNGYRPEDTVWFKTTIDNKKLTEKTADTDMQGALLEPVIYDKMPEYIDTNGIKDNLNIKWYDKDGNEKTAVSPVISQVSVNAPDYGGDMIIRHKENDGSSTGSGHAYQDINMDTAGNTTSTNINYIVYKISFPEGTRLEVGERIELWYEAGIRDTDLPMLLTEKDDGSVYMDYYPKTGEYYQVFDTYNRRSIAYPFFNTSYTNTADGGFIRKLNNSNVMMDMSYLQHDVGLSGKRNDHVSRYEYLQDASVYMPGNGSNTANYGGSSSYLKDYDMASASTHQETIYKPQLEAGKIDDIPSPEAVEYQIDGKNRDYYEKLMRLRNGSAQWSSDDEPVIWSQARTHLQMAWLATSSQMISNAASNEETLESLANGRYGKYDKNYYPSSGYYTGNSAGHHRARYARWNDDTITALEYDQDFTTRIGAYNYGDWDIQGGMKFIYVMPRGIEPKRNADGSMDITASMLSGGDSSNPTTAPVTNVTARILQEPGAGKSYRTPQRIQDPLLVQEYMNTTSDSYTGKDEYYANTDDKGSYVLEITVQEPLKKWLNRGSEFGYQMFVDIPSHVYHSNVNEYWYDEVYAAPLDTASKDNRYYQIYDIEASNKGNIQSLVKYNSKYLSTQFIGMDYLYHGYDNSSYGVNDGNTYYMNGSPNMPYINGINISNKEVIVNKGSGTAPAKTVESYHSGNRSTYAATGTRARMRKPMVRTWTSMGETPSSKEKSDYYVMSEAQSGKLNIHLENKYYWPFQSRAGYSIGGVNGSYYSTYERSLHSYTTDGGNMGTLFYPVVNDLLPEGIVPKDSNGKLFSENAADNAGRTLDWTLMDANGSALDAEKSKYEASVEYVKLKQADGSDAEGRYRIIFKQKDGADTVRIKSGDTRIFQFSYYTKHKPDDKAADGTVNDALKQQYQRNHIFVSSQLENFKFLIDNEIAGNPYYVGAYYTPLRNYIYVGDTRKDAVQKSWSAHISGNSYWRETGGVIPSDILDNGLVAYPILEATKDNGIKRYQETDTLELEDYPDIRSSISLRDMDWNTSGSLSHQDGPTAAARNDEGVTTSHRIRVLKAEIKNESYVSTKKPVIDSTDIKNLGTSASETAPAYHPDNKTRVQYGDSLYYTVQVDNKAQSADVENQGDILHAEMNITLHLPKVAGYMEHEADHMYLIIKENGSWVKYEGLDAIEAAGYQVKPVGDRKADDGSRILSFDIITRGDAKTYQDFIDGHHTDGYFGSGDTLLFGLHTKVYNAEDAASVLSGETYWDEDYKASSYVSFHDTSGSWLQEAYPQGGFEQLDEQDMSMVMFHQKKTDSEPETDTEYADDFDLDGVYGELYASDVTARVTVLKPHSVVRADTSIQRIEVSNPDADIRVAEDPTIKGATRMKIYMDQSVNDGAAVGEYLMDYRIPFRGTSQGSGEEATINDKETPTSVYHIRTGVWEIPDTVKEEATRKKLEKELKVHVYGLLSEEGKTPGQANVSYQAPKDNWRADSWVELTSGGVTLRENAVINIPQKDQKRLYQLRFVICADGDVENTRNYPVPQGFRLDIDADASTTNVKEEMNEIDPTHMNIQELPASVTENAAYIEVSTLNQQEVRKHVNHFVAAGARYDDTHVAASSQRSRAGYFITEEIPVISVDIQGKYFKHSSKKNPDTGAMVSKYEWQDDMLVTPNLSTMLKYKAVFNNLSQDEADAQGLSMEVDNSSNPQVSIVLPYLEEIDDKTTADSTDKYKHEKYRYLSYYDGEFENSRLEDSYVSSSKLANADAAWTWYVVDEQGAVVDKEHVYLQDSALHTYQKYTDLTSLQRKVITWDFDGYLSPGQKLVVEFMVPLATKDYGIVSSELLNCKVYAFKGGAFRIHIPQEAGSNEKWALEFDTRDINNNAVSDGESTLVKTLGGLAFESNRVIIRTKSSHSEYGTGLSASGNGEKVPSLVPEGSDYSFEAAILNPDSDSGSDGYEHPILYDVLPYADDITTGGTARDSKWRGFLNIDSIQVQKHYAKSAVDGGGLVKEPLEDGRDVTIWIGPFKKENGKLVKLDIADLPSPEFTNESEWYKALYGTSTDAMAKKQSFMVKLSDLKGAKATLPAEEYEDLIRNIQAIYVEPNKDFKLNGGSKLQLEYKLHAPLNLPGYPDVIDENMVNQELTNAVKEYTGWNTFTTQNGDDKPSISPRAGVFLDAPKDRGYIGHYVWLDQSYNAKFTDEGEYLKRDSDGRWLLNNANVDLDYDGAPDDPGINDVKVELLSEKGYPVNRDGQPVVAEKDGSGKETGKYLVIDETTGTYKTDNNGARVYAINGPEVFTTEKDAYGHNGYFIISNIKPGKYRLRYTFPQNTYDEYAVTTLKLGNKAANGSVTGVDIYRKGDTLPDLGSAGKGVVDCDAQDVNELIVQTKEETPIQIDAIGSDPSTYKAYDERMTAYDMGISHSYIYSGHAWIDIKDNISNGIYDTGELPLSNVELQFYQVDAQGKRTAAIDRDGKNVKVTTDEKGYFKVSLYPGYSYVAVAKTDQTGGVYKSSPVNISKQPLEKQRDNDMYTTDKKENVTYEFPVTARLDANGKQLLTNGSYVYDDYLGLGFVPSGKGYIGKNIFDDVNYNGIMDIVQDENGHFVSEPGIDHVKLIVEQYYYDDGWTLEKESFQNQISNAAGSYIFQNVPTTVTKNGKLYLAGYRVKVDMSTLPHGYTPTMYLINNGLNDSDLPAQGDSDMRYLTRDDEYIILADKAADGVSGANVLEVEGVRYDTSEGISVLDKDAGLTTMELAKIQGRVWEDKNYDGQQNTYEDTDGNRKDEPGINGILLKLIPYYYDPDASSWKKLPNPTDAYAPTTVTVINGEYSFRDLPSSAEVHGKQVLVSYKIHVESDITNSDYAVTRYQEGNKDTDSDLIASSGMLNKESDYIIPAKRVANSDDAQTVKKLYGAHAESFLIHNSLGYYDINKVRDTTGYDAGLRKFEKADISGRIWNDENYDGLMQDSEPGLAGVKVAMMQYYFDTDTGKWKQSDAFVKLETTTDANGDYVFAQQDTYVRKNDTYYLTGYKLEVVNADGTKPDRDSYAITRYRIKDKELRNSDLRSSYKLDKKDEYQIIAQTVKKADNRQQVVKAGNTSYDLAVSEDAVHIDGGFSEYQTSTLQGSIFDDGNYDGMLDTSEAFSKDLKEALEKEGRDRISVTITYFYKQDGQWKPLEIDGVQKSETQDILCDGDGSYKFQNLPTAYIMDKKAYLMGYQLQFDGLPEGYRLTKPLLGKGQQDSSARFENGAAILSKTKADYVGSKKEELNGYIISSAPSTGTDQDMNYMEGYDCVAGRELTDYNIGVTRQQTASFTGRVFYDQDYDGGFHKESETGMNDITLYLQQYIYDTSSHTWELSEHNTQEYTLIDGTKKQYMQKTVSRAAVYMGVKQDGIYTFHDLPTYVEVDGRTRLSAYRIFMQDVPDGYMATYLHKQNVSEETDSDLDLAMENLLHPRTGSGYLIAAKEVGEQQPEESYIHKAEGHAYDIVAGQNIVQLDAGMTTSKNGSIKGRAFEDMDYDGLWNVNKDQPMADIELQLKRSRYDQSKNEWVADNGLDEAGNEKVFYAAVKTDAEGNYAFLNLPSSTKVNGKSTLYGYTLWLKEMPDGMGATKYEQKDDGSSSSLKADTLQVLKQSGSLPEVKNGYLIAAHKVEKDEEANTQYVEQGYDIIRGAHITDYNLGFKRMHTTSIQGAVWHDMNRNGIREKEEAAVDGIRLHLEQYYLNEQGEWICLRDGNAETDDEKENSSLHAVSGKDASYSFEHLETHGIVDGKTVIYGYRVKIDELPTAFTVTEYQTNGGDADSDLKESNGVLAHDEKVELHVLASKADKTIDPAYNVSGYDILDAHPVKHLDAGLKAYETGTLAGIAFVDKNGNGVKEKKEDALKNREVTLEYAVMENEQAQPQTMVLMDSGQISEEGLTYQTYVDGVQKTDTKGNYVFDNLPIMDENGNPYQYRIRMKKPDHMEFTRLHELREDTTQHVNVYGQLVQAEDKNEGVTQPIELVNRRERCNYYGHQFRAEAKAFTYMDIAVKQKKSRSTIAEGVDTAAQALSPYGWLLAGLASLSIVLLLRRKRKEME